VHLRLLFPSRQIFQDIWHSLVQYSPTACLNNICYVGSITLSLSSLGWNHPLFTG
jgi:hypothetical protein